MRHATRNHPAWWAALAHRLSGLALILFLPLHFLSLGLALEGEASLDSMLAWTNRPLVKAGEWGLVTLLTLHLSLGLRVMALELLPWRDSLKTTIAAGAGLSVLTGLVFLLNLV
jgi:fumarate reductase subunit D